MKLSGAATGNLCETAQWKSVVSGTLPRVPDRNGDRHVLRRDATIIAAAPTAVAAGRSHLMLSWLEDAGLLLLLALAFPLVVLIVGAPVALVVRLLIEIGRRWV